MKKILLPVFAGSALLLNSCSTTQLAQQAGSDDVYYTEAKAKVITPVTKAEPEYTEQTYRTDEQLYGDNSYSDRGYDDYSYSSRINRFYYNSPWRPYYDYSYSYGYNPWYTYSYDPFFYDPWLYRPGVSIWVGTYPRARYHNYYGYYGGGYNNGYWGPYSYYNTYPGYGYGSYYGGGYYYGGNDRLNNPNYRPRPNRGGMENYGNGGSSNGSGGTIVTGGGRRGSVPSKDGGRISTDNQPATTNTRPRPTAPGSTTRGTRDNGASTSPAPIERPARAERPTRAERPAQTERYTPPPAPRTRETYSPPASNNNGGSSNGGSSSGGGRSSSGSGGSRPSRGGN